MVMVQNVLLPVIAVALAALGSSTGATRKDALPKTDFNRDIRPILTENCFKCHGPDDGGRKAKLRFDLRAEALKPAKSGSVAIVPGVPDKSELIARITATDLDDRMPPLKTGKKLTATQIETLRRWIAEGAPYATHWAYVKPVRPAWPDVKRKQWCRNPIDSFILARLEREGLKPSPPADRYTLARRVSLDLTGLPPTSEEVDQFVKDRSPRAYESFIDRLLAKPAFGEHWARLWLDLARYADSAGYADDPPRTIWAYRDYVIKAFNANKPFDRFTLEQIAGDLLQDTDEDDLVATGFHRNTMTNNEGGTTARNFATPPSWTESTPRWPSGWPPPWVALSATTTNTILFRSRTISVSSLSSTIPRTPISRTNRLCSTSTRPSKRPGAPIGRRPSRKSSGNSKPPLLNRSPPRPSGNRTFRANANGCRSSR